MQFDHRQYEYEEEAAPLPWYRKPAIILGAGVAALLVALVAAVLFVMREDTTPSPASTTGPVTTLLAADVSGADPGRSACSAAADAGAPDPHRHSAGAAAPGNHHRGSAAPAADVRGAAATASHLGGAAADHRGAADHTATAVHAAADHPLPGWTDDSDRTSTRTTGSLASAAALGWPP